MGAAAGRARGHEVREQRIDNHVGEPDPRREAGIVPEPGLVVVGAAGGRGGAVVRGGGLEAVDRVQVVALRSESVGGWGGGISNATPFAASLKSWGVWS